MIWEDNQFQLYAAHKFNTQYPEHRPYEASEHLAKNLIYRSCKIKLASELENIEENVIFIGLMKAYRKWTDTQ